MSPVSHIVSVMNLTWHQCHKCQQFLQCEMGLIEVKQMALLRNQNMKVVRENVSEQAVVLYEAEMTVVSYCYEHCYNDILLMLCLYWQFTILAITSQSIFLQNIRVYYPTNTIEMSMDHILFSICMTLNNIHLIIPGCLQPSIALQVKNAA